MEYFKKIINKKVNLPLKQEKLLNFYGIQVGDKHLGIGYYDVETSIEKKLLKMFIHPNSRKHFKVSLMIINHQYIPPHIDNDLKMVMNLYVKTSDATTYFWKPKLDNISSIQLDMQTDGRIYKEDDLECMSKFKAEPYDLWMLDVSKIHSVRSESQEFRIAFCFQSNTLSFQEAIHNLDNIIL
jgi:Holliday junction resolvase RusA-like endonuclease